MAHTPSTTPFSQAHLDKANVQLLGGVASLEVTAEVSVIVPNDASNDVRSGHALCPLCRYKHAIFFEWLVDIVCVTSVVGDVVMCNKVNLQSTNHRQTVNARLVTGLGLGVTYPVLLHELHGNLPGGVGNDLINIAAVPNQLTALLCVHHRLTLASVSEFIIAHCREGRRDGEGRRVSGVEGRGGEGREGEEGEWSGMAKL